MAFVLIRGESMNYLNIMILFVVLFFSSNPVIFGQEINDSSNELLEMSISTNKKCYRLQEQIKAVVTIKNNATIPIYIYKKKGQNYLNGLDLMIYNSNEELVGNEDPISFGKSLLPTVSDFLRIEPNQNIKEKLIFSLIERRTKITGTYFLRGYYRSHVFSTNIPNLLSGERVWSFEDHDVYSSKLRIRAMSGCKE